MSGLGGAVAIIGTGTIKFGENFHQSLPDMVYEAVTLALADAGIERGRLEAAWLGCYEPMLYGYEGNSGTAVADPLNLFPIPVTRVAAYCATGIEAVRNAALAVASGEYDVVLAVGAEKMRDVPSRGSLVAQAVNRGHPVLAKGRTAPGHVRAARLALLQGVRGGRGGARRRGAQEPPPRLAQSEGAFPEGDHRGACTRRAPKVAEPLGLFDCCPTTDGAAAAILTRADLARQFTDRYTVIRGIAYAVTAGYWNTQFDPVVELHLVPGHARGGQGGVPDGRGDQSRRSRSRWPSATTASRSPRS